jgi:hypothetical protein
MLDSTTQHSDRALLTAQILYIVCSHCQQSHCTVIERDWVSAALSRSFYTREWMELHIYLSALGSERQSSELIRSEQHSSGVGDEGRQ